MPTLNKTKEETKLVLKWGGIALAIILLFFLGIKIVSFVISLVTPPAAPQASFGKLPVVPFPNQVKENISYTLDTLSGYLPSFSDRAKVYKISSEAPTLLGLDKTREKVGRVGFKSLGTQISEDTYQWINQDNSLQKTITMNIFSSDFALTSPYLLTQSLQTFSGIDEKNSAVKVAGSFLSGIGVSPQDIDNDKTTITTYSIGGSSLIPTSKISDTKIARVDFFQRDVDGLPVFYEKGAISTVDLLVGKENNNLEIVEAHYFHKNISTVASTYAIKTATQAFSELKDGKAFIASKPSNMVEFTIKKVSLGYYMGEVPQIFMMPIIIFEGNDNFVAYVSAVKDEWISN